MKAYFGGEALKQQCIDTMRGHREADTLVQGYGYWKDGKGCGVGCLIKSNNHAEYETRFGIPRTIARLEDSIFEGLPVKEAKLWPERFLTAIKPGSDLSMVFYYFMHWLLVDEKHGVLQYAKTERTKKSILKVAGLYKQYIDGELSLEQFRAAYAADAAADADAAAAYAADAYAADADAAADAAAAYAADAYAADAAADAWKVKRHQARTAQADKLIELLEAA